MRRSTREDGGHDSRGGENHRRHDPSASWKAGAGLPAPPGDPCVPGQCTSSPREKAEPFPARPDCRIRLHFPPPHHPHLNPTGRLWRVMHRHVTHNRFYPDFQQFAEAIMDFFNTTLSRKWEGIAETVTDNFRVITHDEYRLIG